MRRLSAGKTGRAPKQAAPLSMMLKKASLDPRFPTRPQMRPFPGFILALLKVCTYRPGTRACLGSLRVSGWDEYALASRSLRPRWVAF